MTDQSDVQAILTRLEAAEYLRISRAKMDQLIAASAMPSIKLDRRRLFRKTDLDSSSTR